MSLQSERRRLDKPYYTELTFIEFWLKKIKVRIKIEENEETLIRNDLEIKCTKELLFIINL